MPPTIALLLWLVLLLGLLRFDPAKSAATSFALWLPVIWMFIIGSRLPSQWFGGGMNSAAQALEEGNPLDRTIYFGLILLSLCILIARSFDWAGFLRRNLALMAFLSFGLVSVLWSDFTFVAFKRWFRDLGNFLVILVVLSDSNPLEAVRTFLRRLYYLLIPLSILLIKYYPSEGIHYSYWTGEPEYVGAATSKNTIGAICMMGGIFFFWDIVTRWSERKEWRTRVIFLVNIVFLIWMLWLLDMSKSATSRVCLALGCLVILAAHSKSIKRHPAFLKVLMPSSFLVYLILAFGLGLNGELVSSLGRDPSLTGRTNIWKVVLNTDTSPLIGTGYESFWLGPRLNYIWQLAGPVNEAHNGYLEIYLNLGFIGLLLLCLLLISSYRTICKNLSQFSTMGSLSAALWTIVLFYNMTESSFKAPFMCLTFLLGTITVPLREVRAVPPQRIPHLQVPLAGEGRNRTILASSRATHGDQK